MADKILNVRIQQKYDNEEKWMTKNPILLSGELCFSADKKGLYKVGDGIHKWDELPYVDTSDYKLWIVSSRGNILLSSDTSKLTCKIAKGDDYVDQNGTLYIYLWKRYIHGVLDESWTYFGKTVEIKGTDFEDSVTYTCEVLKEYTICDENNNCILDEKNNVIVEYYTYLFSEISIFRNYNETIDEYVKESTLFALKGIGDSTILGALISLNERLKTLENKDTTSEATENAESPC